MSSTENDAASWEQRDWLIGFSALEESLSCQICKEILKAPMITSCEHTFCSLCIRRYISQEQKCPTCRSHETETKLRRNVIVNDVIDCLSRTKESFSNDIQKALRLANEQNFAIDERGRRSNRRAASQESHDVGAQGQSETINVPSSPPAQPASAEEPSQNTASKEGDRVGCPVCSKSIPSTKINDHLDRCLRGQSSAPDKSRDDSRRITRNGAFSSNPSSSRGKEMDRGANRMPKINYSLTNETKLRGILKDLGLPSQGNKGMLQKRHLEWVTLWNANLDSSHPAPKRTLLRQLDAWERSMQSEQRKNFGDRNTASADQDKQWQSKYNDQFDSLIQAARSTQKKRSLSTSLSNESTQSGEPSKELV